MEADLLRYYQIDLARDLSLGRLSFGRLQRLIRKLPADSATALSVHGERATWGPNEHLLAHLIDVSAVANWQRGGGKGSKPTPVKRPGTDQARRTTLTTAEIRRRLLTQDQRR